MVDIVEGFLYGFYTSPPETVAACSFCDEMSKSVAALQKNIADLLAERDKWVTLDYFNSLGFFDKVRLMSGLYL